MNDIKSEKPIENKLYYDLEKYANRADVSSVEKKRVADIIGMLSMQGIFPKNEKVFYTLNEVMQWLDSDQRQALADNILVLKNYCDAEGVKSVLESADVNGVKMDIRVLIQDPNATIHNASSIKFMADTFVTRLGLMTKYVKRVATKTYNDERFCDEFWIRSTGSDPHFDGEHTLFLVNKVSGDIDFVYKPHDLSADNMIVGKTGMLQQLNKDFAANKVLSKTLIKNENAFATIKIDVKNHIEEFVTKKSVMTSQEAKKYFFRAGLLKVITDAMAVIDLHRDNIMPTQNNAPLIIDAEVDFFRYISSGLENDALKRDKQEEHFANSSFKVVSNHKRSGDLFKNEKSVYHIEYNKGYNFMCKYMFRHKKYFADMYEQYLQRVDRVRIVPIETKELNQGLMEYIIGNKINCILDLFNKIKKLLNGIADDGISGFIFNRENRLKVKFDEPKLKAAIKQALDAGTIIALYVSMDGRIYLNQTKVGNIISTENEEAVCKEKIIGVMKKSFLKVVDSYSKKIYY